MLGYIIVACILAQLGLGVQHHFKHQRAKAPTIFGEIHVWLGRLILLLAAVNGFMYVFHPSVADFFSRFFLSFVFANTQYSGFTFALRGDSAIPSGVLICVFTVAVVLLSLWHRPIRGHKFQPVGAQQSHTWRQSSGYNAGYSSRHPPGYEPPSQQIGLQATRSSSENSPWKSGDNDEPQLGNAQRPREFA